MAQRHTVIIGNGIAGITTARHLRKLSKNRITVISSETPYFFSRTALMYVYMGHMKFDHIKPYEDWFWEKNKIDLLHDYVETIDTHTKTLKCRQTGTLAYDDLVLATGSKSSFFDWPGQHLKGVQGLFSYPDLQQLEASTPAPGEKDHPVKQAVIVGGGLIGIELAEMLLYRKMEVTVLVREGSYWGNVITKNESELIAKHAESHGVRIRLNTEVKEILDDGNGNVSGILTNSGETIPCQLVGISTGVRPNIDFLRGSAIEMNKGILADEFLQTNMPDIYAAGDCAELRHPLPGRRAIEPVWYTGRMMGEVLAMTLAGKKSAYRPGPWFNSAKFFDIEYQTYGIVQPTPDDQHKHWFWKKADENQFITVAWHPESGDFQGINSYGIRLKHEYFDRALQLGQHVSQVIGSIDQANFDTEFYKKWPDELKKTFMRETGIAINHKPKRKSIFSR